MGKLYILPVILLAFVLGCSREEASQERIRGPIVTVGAHQLTDEMAAARVEAVVSLTLHRKKLNERDEQKLRTSLVHTLPEVFVRNSVLEDYVRRENVEIPEALIATNRQALFRTYRKKGDKSYAELAGSLGAASNLIERMVWEETVAGVVRKHLSTVAYPTNIPLSYADEEIAAMMRVNAEMEITNRVAYANATNAWRRLQTGENFEAVMREYTEMPDEREEHGVWGSFGLRELAHEPEIVKNLKAFKPGQFSPPMEADNGLMIMRFESVGPGEAGEDEYTISRIFFQLPLFYHPAPKDVIVKAAYERYERELFARKVAEFIKAAKPVYRADVRHGKK